MHTLTAQARQILAGINRPLSWSLAYVYLTMLWEKVEGRWEKGGWATKAIKIETMQLLVVRTLQCLVKGEALVSLCPGHAAMPVTSRLQACLRFLDAVGILKYGPESMTGCLTVGGCKLTWQAPIIETCQP